VRFLVLPALLVTALMMLGPVVLMARVSMNRFDPFLLMESAFTWENYVSALTDSYYQQIMGLTVSISLISAIMTLVIAYPVAYWLAHLPGRWKGIVIIATILPLLVGNIVRISGWIAILGTEGVLNYAFQALGLTDRALQLHYNSGAVIVGSVSVLLPYMIIILSSVMENIPREVEEAARNLGAPWHQVFARIILPMSVPGALTGSVLVFVLCMNAYATPVLLGGPSFTMMAPAIYQQFMRANNWPLGAALAFLLLTTTILLVIAVNLLVRYRYREIGAMGG